ncbi:MAG: hypothetical protein ACQEP3_02905 [Patescibacteria group bacterium]
MDINKINFKKMGSYFSEENSIAVESFLEALPIKYYKEVGLNVKAKVYSQNIFMDGKHINTIPFYVVGISPSESISRINIEFNRRFRLSGGIRIFSEKYEFKSILTLVTGDFFTRLYNAPVRIKLNAPSSYSSKVIANNRDFI